MSLKIIVFSLTRERSILWLVFSIIILSSTVGIPFTKSLVYASLMDTPQTSTDNSNMLCSDVNGDGVVNILDLAIVAQTFGSYPGHPKWNPEYDLNKDGIVNLIDVLMAARDFGMRWLCFDFDEPLDWNVVSGTWSIFNGSLEGFSNAEGLIFARDIMWKDCTLTARMKIASDSPTVEAAFCVRFIDSGNFYWAGLGCWGHKVSISRMTSHVPEELIFSGDKADVVKDVWYTVSIEVSGATIKLYINNMLELEYSDSTFAGGGVGIRPYNSHIVIDYVTVKGTVVENSSLIPNDTVIHVDGITLRDAFGNEVFLKGVNVHRNERRAENGRFWGIDDVKRIKDSGGNCLELCAELLCDWMPERNQINESYFINWLDKEVSWCEQYGIYYIINVRGFHGNYDWARKEPFLPDWLWEDLGYSKPTNQELADLIIRDFFDTDVQKQEVNREAFINAWKFVANRYRNNKYALFGLVNEPLCGVKIPSGETARHLGVTYSILMTRVIDAVRSVGAEQVVFIDRPYVWSLSNVQPVHRPNIVWEDHLYVTQDKSIDSWKTSMDGKVQRFVYDFGKPLYIGEYGCDRPANPSNFKDILQKEVTYLKALPICGRGWHCYSHLEGEYNDYKYDFFTAEESEWIIQTVLGG